MTYNVRICVDCLFFWANGDLPEDSATAENVMAQVGIVGENPNPNEHWTVSPTIDEGSFSWSPCDGCRSRLGGDRFEAIAWDTNDLTNYIREVTK